VIADPTVPDAALDAIACVAGPGCPIDVIAGAPVSRGPFGQDEPYRRRIGPHNAVIHEVRRPRSGLIHEIGGDVDESWIGGAPRRPIDRLQADLGCGRALDARVLAQTGGGSR
jgi:hypothetical protein